MIEIIPFSEKHREGVVDVILSIQQSEFGIPITIDEQPNLLDIPNFYQKGNGNFWVALSDSEVVGTISLLDIGNDQSAPAGVQHATCPPPRRSLWGRAV